jgi:hypothetical protein
VNDSVLDAGSKAFDYWKNGSVLGHIGGENGEPNAYGKFNARFFDAAVEPIYSAGNFIKNGGIAGHLHVDA